MVLGIAQTLRLDSAPLEPQIEAVSTDISQAMKNKLSFHEPSAQCSLTLTLTWPHKGVNQRIVNETPQPEIILKINDGRPFKPQRQRHWHLQATSFLHRHDPNLTPCTLCPRPPQYLPRELRQLALNRLGHGPVLPDIV